ncbi:MAG TPA: hypothetical protein VFK06_24590 [Candidatus Angelobacter sp.]|nr:hypothetical protein [Candidatus Angelobacter sp.]
MLNNLEQFTGSETVYRHGLMKNVLYTEGVHYVAEKGSAYWLIDEIATSQHLKQVAGEEFQHWTLTVNLANRTAVLVCDDGNGNVVFSKEIEFTDFPLDHINFYFTNQTICLPSEY